jgi:hypothetical protein
MTNDRISAWLEDLGLGIYRDSFQQNAIDWEVLPELNEGDLEALGVLLGHRKRLLRALLGDLHMKSREEVPSCVGNALVVEGPPHLLAIM